MKFTLSRKKDVHLSFDANIRVLTVNKSTSDVTLGYDVTYNHLKYQLHCHQNTAGIVTFSFTDNYCKLVEAISVSKIEPKVPWEVYFDLDFLKKHIVDEVSRSIRHDADLITEIQMMRNASAAVSALGTASVNKRQIRSI